MIWVGLVFVVAVILAGLGTLSLKNGWSDGISDDQIRRYYHGETDDDLR